ncbi:MAG TPA: 30S ribosomal protein THX [Steroidobacteraceae bacterium]|nr:30S ribosomal protein THX [Steroidobacteraceae bacterium]
MGKGDRRTRRGKLYRGSFGKSRAKDPAKKRKAASKTGTSRVGAGAAGRKS